MSRQTLQLTPPLCDYLVSVGVREDEILRELREETAARAGSGMQISPEQGQLMRFLVRVTNTRKALEVGVFTGYSGLCVALELPRDGVWIGCDSNPETTAVARRYFQRAGLAALFDVRLGQAVETLRQLLAAGHASSFDFIFIDADKESYDDYYELGLRLLRRGGVIAFDNVLWGGTVIDPAQNDEATKAIRVSNEKIHADDRVAMVMVPVGDGLTLACKL